MKEPNFLVEICRELSLFQHFIGHCGLQCGLWQDKLSESLFYDIGMILLAQIQHF